MVGMLSFSTLKRNKRLTARLLVWAVLAVFSIVFGFMTTVDAGVFMAIVSLLVGLIVTQLLQKSTTRAQGGSH